MAKTLVDSRYTRMVQIFPGSTPVATSLFVTPRDASTNLNQAIGFSAEIRDQFGRLMPSATNTITFSSSLAGTWGTANPVTPVNGVAQNTLTPTAQGAATITVTASGLNSDQTQLQVIQIPASIELLPASASIGQGEDLVFNARMLDGSSQTIVQPGTFTFSSDNSAVETDWTPGSEITTQDGTAQVTFNTQMAGTHNITAAAYGVVSVARPVTVGQAAIKLELTPVTPDIVQHRPIEFTARALDGADMLDTSFTGDITFASSQAGTWSKANPVAAVGGVATNTFTPDVAGTHSITISATGLTSGNTDLNVTPEQVTIVEISGNDQVIADNVATPDPLVARVDDPPGQPLPNEPVTITPLDDGSVNPTNVNSDAGGLVQSVFTSAAGSGGKKRVRMRVDATGDQVDFDVHVPNRILRFAPASPETAVTHYRVRVTPNQGTPKIWDAADYNLPFTEHAKGFKFDGPSGKYVWDLGNITDFPSHANLQGLYDVAVTSWDGTQESAFSTAEDAYFYFGGAPPWTFSMFDFASNNGVLQLTGQSLSDVAAATLSFWVDGHTDPPTDNHVFGCGGGGSATNGALDCRTRGSNNNLSGRGWGVDRVSKSAENTANIRDGNLHHVVVCYQNPGNVQAWVDGVAVTGSATTGLLDLSIASIFMIGENHSVSGPGWGNQLNAKIGDIGLFPYAMTQAKVDEIYNSGTPINPGNAGSNYGMGTPWVFFGHTMTEADWLNGLNQGSLGNFTWQSR